ncbi:alkaline phosphatase [Pseudonocardia humida]|uniref:Alkaline phosphatase n=1 Tax=Pseudonocardia humida TaxID=2800819 RepID=A0ABT1ABN8_9PSEU|nr:alkaline phosphatase [Pseudonocardia humida]MCO1660350.1 alkaline phosphatase [Pseudonocardia humida]
MPSRLPVRLLTAAVGVTSAAAVVVAVTATAGRPAPAAVATGPARSVIFITGDGMGEAHRAAGRLHLVGPEGQLQMDQLPHSGSLTTDPRDPGSVITDSAAGASAWATGQKTYNGAISVDVEGNALPTIGQQAKAAGKATGLVTTAQVTDATPAAFFASTTDRALQDQIARQYLEVSEPDVILGGGEDWWLPAGSPGAYPDNPPEDPDEASQGEEGDLVAAAQAAGYAYVSTAEELDAASGPKLLGLFANQEQFQQEPEGQGDVYSPVVGLATMTEKALDTLDAAPDGFFLLVEEEAVDEFAHANNGEKMLLAMRELDAAVAVARAYVAEHPDTLLVVTGDHETGGLAVEDGTDTEDESGDGDSAEDGPFPAAGSGLPFTMDWTTGQHTGGAVPVTADGPGAERFSGQHPNTHVHEVLSTALGL